MVIISECDRIVFTLILHLGWQLYSGLVKILSVSELS